MNESREKLVLRLTATVPGLGSVPHAEVEVPVGQPVQIKLTKPNTGKSH